MCGGGGGCEKGCWLCLYQLGWSKSAGRLAELAGGGSSATWAAALARSSASLSEPRVELEGDALLAGLLAGKED